MNQSKRNPLLISAAILLASLVLAYSPIPGLQQTITVVSGTELEEPLKQLKSKFEQAYPNIKLDLKFQGSQDLISSYIDEKNDFKPTILIPASGELLEELKQRWQSQHQEPPFYETPQPIAKTILVGIAWSDRGKILFPEGSFSWQRLEQALKSGNWQKIGGQKDWGSFDFLMTDPTRSNSGQITLKLWLESKGMDVNNTQAESLFKTIKSAVYQPPRSTDILLQEFIARGPNDADVATVYESIALYRWQQAGVSQGKPYQIYYLNPTIETVATAAIVHRDVGNSQAKAAKIFIDFLIQTPQQETFVQYGFRPIINGINLSSVSQSPWNQNIPGSQVDLSVKTFPAPNSNTMGEIQRLWNRAN